MQGLKDYSHKPKNLRKAEYDVKLVKEIEVIRREHLTYSAKKIKVILSLNISVSTVGRIIKRYGFYYIGKDIKRRVSVHISSSSKSSKAVIAPQK